MSDHRSPHRALAEDIASAIAARRSIAPISQRDRAFSMDEAYRTALALRAVRGERVIGRKIGFTNRSIWAKYGVDAPMWGDMTERSVHGIGQTDDPVPLSGFVEPKLEPEIALKLRHVPAAGASDEELLAAVEWFAPAFEIVHSIFANWQFALTDCVAMGALHGALFLGEAVPAGDWARALPDVGVVLSRGGSIVERGVGANALDGPLSALRHLVDGTEALGDPLAAGDIVTTGTLTDAQDIRPGDTWTATYEGAAFQPITLRFAEGAPAPTGAVTT